MLRGHRHALAFTLGVAALTACAAPRNEGDERAASGIQGGAPAPAGAHPAVGVVRLGLVESFCSATLIAPDVVLTAGHCIEWEGETITAFYTGNGQATLDDQAEPSTVGMRRHPAIAQAMFPAFEHFYSCPDPELDLALVRLETPIDDITPIPLGDAPLPGTSCTAVGFGAHDTDAGETTFLEKRVATVTVGDVRAMSLDVLHGDGFADRGDSGGPLLCGGALVGVTSCVPDYPDDAIAYGNLAAGRAWIQAMIDHWDPRTNVDGSRPRD